jgi:hypothetical protein
MISYAGIPECISLIHIVLGFSLLVREENLNICRFNELFTLNYAQKITGEQEVYHHIEIITNQSKDNHYKT